jgi:hypothetical protein
MTSLTTVNTWIQIFNIWTCVGRIHTTAGGQHSGGHSFSGSLPWPESLTGIQEWRESLNGGWRYDQTCRADRLTLPYLFRVIWRQICCQSTKRWYRRGRNNFSRNSGKGMESHGRDDKSVKGRHLWCATELIVGRELERKAWVHKNAHISIK